MQKHAKGLLHINRQELLQKQQYHITFETLPNFLQLDIDTHGLFLCIKLKDQGLETNMSNHVYETGTQVRRCLDQIEVMNYQITIYKLNLKMQKFAT